MLIDVYDRLKRLKLKCIYHLFDVSNSEQISDDNITYNQYIPYDVCLKEIQSSNCLLDIIQGNSEGYTLKVCEAIFYDKLLITSNQKIKEAPFYDPQKILIISDAKDIDLSFFNNASKIKYSKKDKSYFSVESFIKRLNNDLNGK